MNKSANENAPEILATTKYLELVQVRNMVFRAKAQ